MNSKTDFAEDIRLFREAVTSSIIPLSQQLEKELARISVISPRCHEKVAIELFGKKHYKDPHFFDYIKADGGQWISIIEQFCKIITKDNSPSYFPETESRLSQFRWREQQRSNELNGVISSISGFLPKIKDGFVLEASFNYAQRRKHITDGDDNLPLREDIVPFLSMIQQTDVILGDRIITHISQLVGPQFRDYLLTNNNAEAEGCLPVNDSKIRPILIEVAALQSGLSIFPQVLSAVKKSLGVCRRIDENFFLNERFNAKAALPDFPSTSYDDVRSNLEQCQEQWTKEEYLAILGKEKKDYTFQYKEPQNGEYFPGLKESCWYTEIIHGIASAVSSCECIDEQDEALFMFLFFGFGDAPKQVSRLYWKDQYDSRKKDGTVRHPSELYYLLDKLYSDRSVFSPEYVLGHLEFSAKTESFINDILSKGRIQQMAQRCNQGFQKTIDQIIENQ